MSMHEYPVYLIGVHLDENAEKRVSRALNDDTEDVITTVYAFEGCFYRFNAVGHETDSSIDCDDTVSVISLDNAPNLFAPAYSNFDEIIAEIREKTNNALSIKYIKEHFGVLEGVEFS